MEKMAISAPLHVFLSIGKIFLMSPRKMYANPCLELLVMPMSEPSIGKGNRITAGSDPL